MGSFLAYTLASGLFLIAGYLIYKWLLAPANQPRFNRAMLLGIYVVALSLWPLLSLRLPASGSATVEIGRPLQIIVLDNGSAQPPVWPLVLAAVYLAGVGVILLWTLLIQLRLLRIVRRGERIRRAGYTLVLTDDHRTAPFSWGRYIVMSRADRQEAGQMILCHERAHIRAGHFFDLLLGQAVCCLFWYNPASWLMLAELKGVHEFEADERVLASGVEARAYQMLLIKKAVGDRFPSLANSLNHSTLKQRITMINSNHNPWRRLGALALLPALAGAVALTHLPAVASGLDALESSQYSLSGFEGKVSEKSAEMPAAVQKNSDNPAAQASAQASAGEPADSNFNEVAYYLVAAALGGEKAVEEAEALEPAAKATAGGEQYQLTLDGRPFTGNINDISPESISSITVDKSTTPVTLHISTKNEKAAAAADKIAEYPGGQQALIAYMADNLKYPSGVKIDKSVRAVVTFTVNKDGTISDARIRNSVDPALAGEALRVVGKMPAWEPATSGGQPVATEFTLPVVFSPTAR